MKAHPMIAILAVVIAGLLLLDYFKPSALLYQTEYEAIDSLRTYTFVLRGEPKETKRCWRYEAVVQGVGRVYLYILRDTTRTQPQAGDTLVARTRIRRGGQIGDFDYGLYLRRQGFIGTAFTAKYQLSNTYHPSKKPFLQAHLYKRLAASGLSGDELATTGALTLGYKEDLDPQLRQHFQASGAAHVLAVSGLHTGIIYAILLVLFTIGGRLKPRYENRPGRVAFGLVIIAAMWFYAWLTGLTPSVVRSVLMITMVEVGRMLYRQSLTLNSIAAAAVLILLARPLDLWSISFQLSFAATTAIVLFVDDIERLLPQEQIQRSNKLLNWFIGTIIVSLAAQLGTLPITMYTFGQMSNYFMLTNLIVLPVATLLVPCGMLSIALGGCWLGRMIGYITYGLAWTMNHAVAWIESLPGSTIAVHINGWQMLLLYAAIAFGWLALHPNFFTHSLTPSLTPSLTNLFWLLPTAAALIGFCIMYIL